MLSAGLLVVMMAAAPVQDLMIPEGTILPVVLNETLNTAKVQENDPILFTLAEDIRAAGRRGPGRDVGLRPATIRMRNARERHRIDREVLLH